jgi:hypothetical protein
VVAIAAVVPAYRQLKLLGQDQRADREERQRSQAVDFSFWIEHRDQICVMWANRSSAPVYDVFGQMLVQGDVVVHFSCGTLGPTDAPVVDEGLSRWLQSRLEQLLRAELGHEAVDRTYEHDDPYADYTVGYREGDLASTARVRITFRDSAGLIWQRESDGRLIKLTEPSPMSDTSEWKPVARKMQPHAGESESEQGELAEGQPQ